MATTPMSHEVSVSTMIRTKLSDGKVLGVDGSVWLIRKLPLEPVADAKSVEERMNVYMPLMAAYDELSSMAAVSMNRRSVARANYRQTQLLMVNLSRLYNPAGHKISGFLKESFPEQVTEKRIVLLAVKLVGKVGADGGFRKAMDSVVETLVSGGTPLSDYDDDFRKVDAAMARCGLSTPTAQDISMANSWWNQGEFPDTVDLPHSDHLHVFADTKAVRMANDAGREDCTKWPKIPNHRSLTLATLADFSFEFESSESTAAHWATGLVEDGAVAISIRGGIEPAKVTRGELRRQRKRYMDDINERHKQNKMEDSRQQEMLQTLELVENVYAGGGSPTLVDASVLVAFDGEVEDITQAGPRSAANLRIMNFRQRQGLAEMMLCSGVRANPNLHDLPIQVVACSGIQSLSTVGDKDGALLGFTERDSQPAYESPTAASSGDAAPIFVNLGATGSGKSMVMLWKAIQFAKLGGPQVLIDPKAVALDTRIPTPSGWTTMGDIQVGDQVIGRDGAPCNVVHKSRIFNADETHLYEFVFDDGQVIRADQNHQWVVASPKDRTALKSGLGRTAAELNALANSADVLALSADDSDVDTTTMLLERLRGAGVNRWTQATELRAILKRSGVVAVTEVKPFRWPSAIAFKALAAHLHEEASMGTDHLRVLTTEDLLEHGVTFGTAGQTYWAAPVPAAVQFPAAELAVDPYLVGAWLGDGFTKSGSICAGLSDADEMRGLLQEVWPLPVKRTDDARGVAVFSFPRDASLCKRGHSDFVPTVKDSIRCRACGTGKAEGEVINGSLGDLLAGLGLLRNKRIPAAYAMASVDQRLALLQGLMDTDGTVHQKRSELRITLTRRELAEDVLTLVRSLGIKAHWHESPARLVFRDEHGEKVRKDCGTAYSVTFRTDLPVFRLARKKAIQPKVSFRAGFSYIKEIRPVESAEAQCIRVDSPDHTYLVGDYIVTHNTGSDHSPTVLAHGGQVASLDDLKGADGIFDPLRFSPNPTVGVELAVSMLASIDPWGGKAKEYEVHLYTALSYGVSQGATCVGQALKMAFDAKQASHELVDPIFRLANTSTLFRACVGVDPHTKALSINEGITLIKVGNTHLDLPEPGAMEQASLMQKVSLALVRMMVFGSAMALTGRGGAIHLDEAWVFLGAGKAEVERLGRLARSQQVLPELYTQRASDPLKAGLAGYISRGLILPIEDKDEAKAALELFKLEATDERLTRITGKSTLGDGESIAPNWSSMRALRDPNTREVLRGTIGYYSDLAGRCVPVEIVLPPAFLKLASTNSDDLNARKARDAELALAGASA